MVFLARTMAVLGGVVLCALIALTCLSVLGRGANTLGHSAFLTDLAPGLAAFIIGSGIGPVQGDYEIVEAGIAFAVFAFLPWCQLGRFHASVDVFAALLPARGNRALLIFWEWVFALMLILIAWRLFEGLQGKLANGETTFLLRFPVWWSYAASFTAALLAALVGVYSAAAAWREPDAGRGGA